MLITPASRLSCQLALLTALSLCGHSLPAQLAGQQDQQPEPVYSTARLEGVVVSSLDGKPVPRVLVTSPDQRMAAITDSAGRFSFDFRRGLPQASASHALSSWPPDPVAAPTTVPLQFQLQKPGFVSDNIVLHVASVQPTTPEPTLRLKIVPTATLTGYLNPDSGDLPTSATVQLDMKVVTNGIAAWGYRTAQVNSRGEFRFAHMTPGDYKLLAPAFVPEIKLHDPLPDSIHGFRTSFYPNANSLDSASVLHIRAGETARADLVYRSATLYKVTIPTSGLPDGKGFSIDILTDIPGIKLDRVGTVARGYLPNGSYDFQFRSADVSNGQGMYPTFSIASVHLQIDGKPVVTLPVGFHPAFDVPVEVRVEFTNAPPPQPDTQHPRPLVSIVLGGGREARTDPQGVTVLQNLPEGLFTVAANSSIGGYVASVTSGTTDLLSEPLKVLPGIAPRPVEIILRDDSASINAHLTPVANLLPQATTDQPVYVLCISLDHPLAHADNFPIARDYFSIPNLAPGRYLVLASHQNLSPGWTSGFTQSVEYRNPEVIHGLLGKGAVVTLSPRQTADIEVPLMPENAN
ncbi:MAG: hypothetical protein M3O31_12370 [Acidobacteriota bacterium]|nr:hypothetical protein [Acidobacteriota bacterium]